MGKDPRGERTGLCDKCRDRELLDRRAGSVLCDECCEWLDRVLATLRWSLMKPDERCERPYSFEVSVLRRVPSPPPSPPLP